MILLMQAALSIHNSKSSGDAMWFGPLIRPIFQSMTQKYKAELEATLAIRL